jgi:hypothetical protein
MGRGGGEDGSRWEDALSDDVGSWWGDSRGIWLLAVFIVAGRAFPDLSTWGGYAPSFYLWSACYGWL